MAGETRRSVSDDAEGAFVLGRLPESPGSRAWARLVPYFVGEARRFVSPGLAGETRRSVGDDAEGALGSLITYLQSDPLGLVLIDD